MGVQDNDKDEGGRSPLSIANREIVAGGIVVATIFLFVANGSAVLPSIGQLISGAGANADTVLATTLILNIALLLFGWRRYVDLSREVRERTEA